MSWASANSALAQSRDNATELPPVSVVTTAPNYIASTITTGDADTSMELFNPGIGLAVYGGVQYKGLSERMGLFEQKEHPRPF